MTTWQDIGTAPRDGTEVLLFTHHGGDVFCEEPFDAVQIGYWDEGNNKPGTVWHREPGWHQEKIGEPTHWMPLPSPPSKEGV